MQFLGYTPHLVYICFHATHSTTLATKRYVTNATGIITKRQLAKSNFLNMALPPNKSPTTEVIGGDQHRIMPLIRVYLSS